ncbi:electron transfer flavoprotein beta subunit lysine methyltransferase isoform X2 [Amyelois transitella]|uniref:electron transfer flavoprotein beta subunit lysine methyltransferase isoform X2 n=1 Tax=Amyelois transitella TaxID=680683 RepID=UPI00299018E6|nr:electron transfer flavoprotein beta subunit lysine methyltransferase isoform X2 [Amyelois transitella]
MLKDVASLIIKHTAPSRRHLTPELVLRLVTPSCPLWTAKEDQVPFKDPFWAFYWPGGQATARYILDNEEIIKNKRVLDIGCGCGAGSIAAAKMQAKRVVGNDIDLYAVIATKINSQLNNVAIETSTDNFIGAKCEEFDTILIGDMFYDEEFANILFEWLISLTASGFNRRPRSPRADKEEASAYHSVSEVSSTRRELHGKLWVHRDCAVET